MKLLVDVGNTRVKWALLSPDGKLSAQQSAVYAAWSTADWQHALFGATRVDGVLAVTVAGAASRESLESAARRAGAGPVEFVTSTASRAGVRNAYPAPHLLGADRWAAVIGAWHVARRACCVVDVGTAATLDAIDAGGRHLGGFIVPGPELMVRSLHAGTSDLASRAAASVAGHDALLADNTREAIERGCRVAIAALVDRTYAQLARGAADPPALYGTGGAVEQVLPYVLATCERIPDLVLRGLARIAHSAVEP